MIVTYREGQASHKPSSRPAASGVKERHASPAKALSEEDREMYETIRRWRAKQAKEDGVPAFVILNNDVLTEIVRCRPQSRADLESVVGFGKASMERYADILLGFFREAPQENAICDVGKATSQAEAR